MEGGEEAEWRKVGRGKEAEGRKVGRGGGRNKGGRKGDRKPDIMTIILVENKWILDILHDVEI